MDRRSNQFSKLHIHKIDGILSLRLNSTFVSNGADTVIKYVHVRSYECGYMFMKWNHINTGQGLKNHLLWFTKCATLSDQ
jgi:hypothetical protein